MARSNVRYPCSLLSLLLLLVLTNSAAAQELSPGTRIRLSDASRSTVTGRVLAVGRDSILFRPFRTTAVRSLPMDRVISLERSLGGNAGAGALKGALFGSIIGGTLVGLKKAAEPGDEDAMLGFVLAGGVGGMLAGSVIGAVRGGERWLPVPRHNLSGTAPLPTHEQRSTLLTQMQIDSLPPGVAVQIRLFDGRRLSGTYSGRAGDQVNLRRDSVLQLRVTNIEHVALRERATVTFAKRGLLIGALSVGVFLGAGAWLSDCQGGVCPAVQAVGAGTLLGGATGLIVGTLIGASTERWQVQHW